MYGPRGRITSFFRAVRRAGRQPAAAYGAAAAAARAVRNVMSGNRRRITPTRVPRPVFDSKKRAFTAFPTTGPLVTGAGGVSEHVFALNQPVTKQVAQLERLGAPNVYTTQQTFELVAAAGEQNTASLTYAPTAALQSIGNLAGLTQPRGPQRYVLEGLQSETVMTNMSTAPMDIEIWDLVLKRDLPTYQKMTWAVAGVQTEAVVIGDPESYFTAGIHAGTSTAVASANQALVIGASPYDSDMFKSAFRCVKKTNIILNQGSSHRIVGLHKINRLLNQDEWSSGQGALASAGALNGIRGVTSYSMIRIKGMPCAFTPEAGVAITTSAARLAVVAYWRYKYTYCVDNTSSLNYVEALVSPAVDLGIINVGSGEPENQAFAPFS